MKQGLEMRAILRGVVFITAELVQIPMSDAALLNNLTCVCIHVSEWICKGLLLRATTARVLRRDQKVLGRKGLITTSNHSSCPKA